MKTFRVMITVEQTLAMQLEATTQAEAYEKAQRLVDSGSYAVENENCYDSTVTVDQADEIIESNEIDVQTVEDNKNYLSDIEE